MSVRTILAALALETENDPVLGRAMQLAAQHDARLILVHVIEDANFGDPDLPVSVDLATVSRILEKDAVRRIGESIAGIRVHVPVEILVEAGKPYEIINDLAQRHTADLMVIGPGKARAVREKVFGSTADRVVRSVSRPVLVVKSPVVDPYRRIVAAVDFSSQAEIAARSAARLAPAAAIELVHVVEIPLAFEQALRKAGTPQVEIDRYCKARAQAAHRRLLAEFPAMGDRSGRPRLRVIRGNAGAALVRLSRSRRTDLIALGTKGRNVAARLMLGSVAREVLRAASCDVLVSSD